MEREAWDERWRGRDGMRGEMERGEVVATVGGRPAIGIRWRAGFGCGGEGVEKGG